MRHTRSRCTSPSITALTLPQTPRKCHFPVPGGHLDGGRALPGFLLTLLSWSRYLVSHYPSAGNAWGDTAASFFPKINRHGVLCKIQVPGAGLCSSSDISTPQGLFVAGYRPVYEKLKEAGPWVFQALSMFPKQNVNTFIVARIAPFFLPCVMQLKEKESAFSRLIKQGVFRLRHLHQTSAWLPSHLPGCPAVMDLQFPCWQIRSSQGISLCWSLVFFPLCNRKCHSGTGGEEMWK